jgi:hypothetical protein
MQTRYRAAAMALLLTATAGMAATGGAAEASGTHHAGAKAAKSLTITVKSKSGKVGLSDHSITPGNTIFKVKNIDGKASKGDIQMVRFENGYTLDDLFADIPGLFGGDTATVQRVDDNVVFYGGMKAKGKQVNMWEVDLDVASTYYLLHTRTGNVGVLHVAGTHADRALPSRSGFIDAVTTGSGGNQFVAGTHNKRRGWMSTKNKAAEPHFVDIEQVKKGTKNSDITKFFEGQGAPPFVRGGSALETGVISPGHRFLWSYDMNKGRYVVLCFYPSREDGMDGMPHALMGMHIITKLG